MARRTKLTPERQQRIVTLLAAGNPVETAAEAAGVAKATVYRWLERGEREKSGAHCDFRDAVTRARAEAEARNVAVLQQVAIG
jgi:DNA invertase Pin-like site-specific DNA recombinase